MKENRWIQDLALFRVVYCHSFSFLAFKMPYRYESSLELTAQVLPSLGPSRAHFSSQQLAHWNKSTKWVPPTIKMFRTKSLATDIFKTFGKLAECE